MANVANEAAPNRDWPKPNGNKAKPKDEIVQTSRVGLLLRAVEVKELASRPGVFQIVFEGQNLTQNDLDVLAKLFPHLRNEAEFLLNKEVLLASLIDPVKETV